MIPTPQQQEQIDNLNAGQTLKIDNVIYWVSLYGEKHNKGVKE